MPVFFDFRKVKFGKMFFVVFQGFYNIAGISEDLGKQRLYNDRRVVVLEKDVARLHSPSIRGHNDGIDFDILHAFLYFFALQ